MMREKKWEKGKEIGKRKKMGGKEGKGGGVRASGDRSVRPREVGARGRGRERKKERGKRRGGIRGGRSRRVALDGKEMGRGLKFGVGLFGRGSGNLGFRV